MAHSNNPIGPFVKSCICDIRNSSVASKWADAYTKDQAAHVWSYTTLIFSSIEA